MGTAGSSRLCTIGGHGADTKMAHLHLSGFAKNEIDTYDLL